MFTKFSFICVSDAQTCHLMKRCNRMVNMLQLKNTHLGLYENNNNKKKRLD
jgi:hypothetical protein